MKINLGKHLVQSIIIFLSRNHTDIQETPQYLHIKGSSHVAEMTLYMVKFGPWDA